MNFEKIEKIIKSELNEFNFEYNFENGFNLVVWDKSYDYLEDYIIEKVENCLLEIKNYIVEKYKEDFESEIYSDIWYSGFRNENENELNYCCKNYIEFNFDFE